MTNINREELRIALKRAAMWLKSHAVDEGTKAAIKRLIAIGNHALLIDRFHKNLKFGTGGLRALMGIGTNYINRYTIAMATQGLSNYLNKLYPHEKIRVAIAYDSRHNSHLFASVTSRVLSANGIFVHIFPELRPTPLLSFAVRYLKCKAGVVITASHNPKAYNGYKIYGEDGAQLLAPHDENVMAEINALTGIDQVKWSGDPKKIKNMHKQVEASYFKRVKKLIADPDIIGRQRTMPIIYSGLHGTGITMIPTCLSQAGFENCIVVETQKEPDGAFPTVSAPNPENPEAMKEALKVAQKKQADLVMATDPDADRVGIGVRKKDGDLVLLNGNQIFSLMLWFILKHKEPVRGGYIVKTIVTTDLVETIAKAWNIPCYNTLTGFKYIAEQIRNWEKEKTFIVAGEESYGFLIDSFVRDKDAVSACAFLAYMAAYAKDRKTSLHEWLIQLYVEYGLYVEDAFSVDIKKAGGEKHIWKKVKALRASPPAYVDNERILEIIDFKSKKIINLKSNKITHTSLPNADVFQLLTDKESKISIRPSGTEPKIKFYISVKSKIKNHYEYEKYTSNLQSKIRAFKKEILSLLELKEIY